jgi:hypothetical protein
MIRFPSGIPAADIVGHRPAGTRLATGTPLPAGMAPAALPPAPPEDGPPQAVILELSTSALKERITLLLDRFAPAGWTVLGIGRGQGFLAQALAERPAAAGRVELIAFGDEDGEGEPPASVVPAEPVDAVLLDDDVMGLPGLERTRLVRHGLAMLRPGGRLLLVVSDAGTGLWAEGFALGEPGAEDGGPVPFGRAGLEVLHRDGCDLGARSCFEFVLETPWPEWIAALPASIRAGHGRSLWRLQRRLDRLRALWPRLRWRLIELIEGEDEAED